MENKEEQIISQIEVINDMLSVVQKELNELETIDNYVVELQEPEYKIIVTVEKHLESQEWIDHGYRKNNRIYKASYTNNY